MRGTCLTVRLVDRVLVVRQNDRPPTEEDWQIFLDAVREVLPHASSSRALVFSDGGGPTVEQRKRLATVMKGRELQTAVICDAGVVRFVVATISLFNKTMKTFGWNDTQAAYEWLGLSYEERRHVEFELGSMGVLVNSWRVSMAPTSRNLHR